MFSHAQTVVVCAGCATVLCQPTGGKARLTEGKMASYHVRLGCVSEVSRLNWFILRHMLPTYYYDINILVVFILDIFCSVINECRSHKLIGILGF